jgi:hypothetical protein
MILKIRLSIDGFSKCAVFKKLLRKAPKENEKVV